jgi:Transposase IS4
LDKHRTSAYISIDRKPEDGCEIQNAACGCSGVMIQLKLVKSPEAEANRNSRASGESGTAPASAGLTHGGKVLKELVLPWASSGRLVCADSYFASVATADALLHIGLKFIGVIKTATKKYPMDWLGRYEFGGRGQQKGLIARGDDGLPKMLAFVWVDRDRRYFIATTSSLRQGTPYTRYRWRQVNQQPDAEPERVELQVQQPEAAELYYSTCAMIERHNRYRQDDLQLEKKLQTKEWSMRVGMSIFGMIVVDTWIVYKEATDTAEPVADFFAILAEELINNNYSSQHNTRRRCRLEFASSVATVVCPLLC